MILNDNMIPLIIVGIFLLATLIIGLYGGKGIKTFKDYALGSERFNTTTLVLTFLATFIGGGSIGAVDKIYSSGIIITIASFGLIFQHLLFALVISPKIVQFKQCLTIGDLMDQLYGKKIKIFTGILCFFSAIFTIAIQFYMIGKVCNSLLGVNTTYGIIIGGAILSFYSAIGGIKAVALTDVFQFLILIIIIPIIATLLLNQVGGYKELFLKVPREKFLIFDNKDFYYYLNFFLVYAFLPRNLILSAIMQRVFMVKHEKQLKNKFLASAVFDPIFRIVLMIIGLCGIILYPNMESNDILIQIINNLFNNTFMKGMAVSGMLAILMSTADSFIHSTGLVIYNDIYKPLFIQKTKKDSLPIVKIATIIIGIFSIFIAIQIGYGLNFLNALMFSYKFLMSTLLFPLFIGIIGIKTDRKSLIVGIVTALIYIIVSNYFFSSLLNSMATPIATLVNAIAYMIFHIIQNKGIAWVKRDKNSEETMLWIPSLAKIYDSIIKTIPTPRKIFIYSRRQVASYGSYNMLFGIYCVINFTLPYFLWAHKDAQIYNLMTNLRLIGGILGGLLIVRSEWKDFLKPYYPLFWHTTLTYCLPFITTVMFLLTNGSFAWLMNVGVSIFFLVILVAGEMFLVIYPIGVILGLAFYKYFVGPINLSSLGFDINYYLVYQLTFPTIIALLFAYRKKLFYMIKSNQGLNLGLSMGHELKNTGLNILPYTQISEIYIDRASEKIMDGKKLYCLDEKSYKYIKENNSRMHDLSNQMLRIVKGFEQLMIEYRTSLTNPQLCSLKELVEETIDQYHFATGQREQIGLELSQDFRVKVPRKVFIFVIDNIIRNAFKYGNPSKIDIWIENDELHIRDNGKGISSNKLSDIFKMFYTTGDKVSSGIGLAFAKQIIETANGEIWCNSQTGAGSYTEFTIKFPAILMDVSDEEQQEVLVEKVEKKVSRFIAKRLLNQGIDKDTICESTGLNQKEIDNL